VTSHVNSGLQLFFETLVIWLSSVSGFAIVYQCAGECYGLSLICSNVCLRSNIKDICVPGV